MEFVRQNLVLIVLAVVVIVVGGVLMATAMATDKKLDAAAAQRHVLSGKLTRCDKTRVNRGIVADEQRRVEQVRQAHDEVISQSVEWNRRLLADHMLSAEVIVGGESKRVAAFPAMDGTYDEYLLFNLTEAYGNHLRSLLEPLKTAQPPTPTDVDRMRSTAIRKLQQQSDKFKTAPPDDPELNREATALAREMVRREGGMDKHIYADASALDFVFSGATTDVDEAQLWKAQLSLWVTADVLDAIRQTNEQVIADAQAGDPNGRANVGLSGIRRLLRLQVLGYAAPGTAVPAGRSGASSGTGRRRTTTLSGRSSNTLYDVVYYQLAVIMPIRHIATFERVLMSHNYHTVLNVSMQAFKQDASDLYYYGAEPMMQVVVTGELLLLTAWERGTWDDKAKTWQEAYSPLMPVTVLKQLPSRALRPEDQQRVK